MDDRTIAPISNGFHKPEEPVKPKKKYNYTKKAGKPIRYRPEIIEQMVQFFSRPKTYEVPVKLTTKGGSLVEKTEVRANPIPLFSEFARQIGFDENTIIEWSKIYPEFKKAHSMCRAIQKEFLIQNGCLGLYNAQTTIFVAKNITDMRDDISIEHSIAENTLSKLHEMTTDQLQKRAIELTSGAYRVLPN